MKHQRGKNWRRIYHYLCTLCGKKRFTYIYEVKLEGVCHKCKKDKPPIGMTSMFDTIENTAVVNTTDLSMPSKEL